MARALDMGEVRNTSFFPVELVGYWIRGTEICSRSRTKVHKRSDLSKSDQVHPRRTMVSKASFSYQRPHSKVTAR